MALVSSNVRVGVSGEIFVAPTGTTAPTNATSTPAGAFVGLGYVSEDGLTETVDRSIDDIKAWQNAATVRSVVTDAKVSFQFTLIETNVATVGFANGTTVTQSAPHGTYTVDASATGGRKSFIFDVIDGTNLKRIYVSEGELTERGDIVYASGEPIGYEATVVAYTAPVVYDTALADDSSSSDSSDSSSSSSS